MKHWGGIPGRPSIQGFTVSVTGLWRCPRDSRGGIEVSCVLGVRLIQGLGCWNYLITGRAILVHKSAISFLRIPKVAGFPCNCWNSFKAAGALLHCWFCFLFRRGKKRQGGAEFLWAKCHIQEFHPEPHRCRYLKGIAGQIALSLVIGLTSPNSLRGLESFPRLHLLPFGGENLRLGAEWSSWSRCKETWKLILREKFFPLGSGPDIQWKEKDQAQSCLHVCWVPALVTSVLTDSLQPYAL